MTQSSTEAAAAVSNPNAQKHEKSKDVGIWAPPYAALGTTEGVPRQCQFPSFANANSQKQTQNRVMTLHLEQLPP